MRRDNFDGGKVADMPHGQKQYNIDADWGVLDWVHIGATWHD